VTGTELIQVIVPSVAIPVLIGLLLVVIRLCRQHHRASATHLPTKPPQATRRQLGAPPVAANNAVGLYIYESRGRTPTSQQFALAGP